MCSLNDITIHSNGDSDHTPYKHTTEGVHPLVDTSDMKMVPQGILIVWDRELENADESDIDYMT